MRRAVEVTHTMIFSHDTNHSRALVQAYLRSGEYKPRSPEEYDWVKACGVKDWFRSEEHARRNATRHGLGAYECKYCPWWHLTRRLKKGMMP